jgi:short-subunit dehydrogenase
LSESLRRELLPFGIDVIVIGPGAVATPIWSKAEQVDVTPYLNTPYAAALNRLRATCSNSASRVCLPSGSARPCCMH